MSIPVLLFLAAVLFAFLAGHSFGQTHGARFVIYGIVVFVLSLLFLLNRCGAAIT